MDARPGEDTTATPEAPEPITRGQIMAAATRAGVPVPNPAAFDQLVNFCQRLGLDVNLQESDR